MTQQEKRFLRRQIINDLLHLRVRTFDKVSTMTRFQEWTKYGQILSLYTVQKMDK